jgi:hypothetical protein
VTWSQTRRRLRQSLAARDWFEGWSVVLGVIFALVAVACVAAFAVAVTSLDDPAERGLASARGVLQGSSTGTVHASRVFALVLFGLFALIAASVSWFLTGDAVRRTVRRMRGSS